MAGIRSIVVGDDETPRGRDAITLADLLAEGGARVTSIHVAVEEPARGLLDAAEREHADLIVIGSTHRSRVGRVLVGSVARRLVHDSPCPVAIAPEGFAVRAKRPRVVAAAFDMSPESRAGVQAAATLAAAFEASLKLVAVEPRAARHFADAGSEGEFAGPAATPRARLRAALERERTDLLVQAPVEARLLRGDPAEQLLEEIGRGIDLLVMGSRGHGGVTSALAGSVSVPVLENASCPVVVVPRHAIAAAAATRAANRSGT